MFEEKNDEDFIEPPEPRAVTAFYENMSRNAKSHSRRTTVESNNSLDSIRKINGPLYTEIELGIMHDGSILGSESYFKRNGYRI